MIKSIIITGPQGSGKSYIASAMACAQDFKKTSTITAANEIEKIKCGKINTQLLTKFSLLIIDECSEKDISDFNEAFKNAAMESKCTILYLTQDKVNKLPGENFWLISLKKYDENEGN